MIWGSATLICFSPERTYVNATYNVGRMTGPIYITMAMNEAWLTLFNYKNVIEQVSKLLHSFFYKG